MTTLFFGELLPKALGVNNAEVVARRVLPIIIVLSWVLNPVAKTFTLISTVGICPVYAVFTVYTVSFFSGGRRAVLMFFCCRC